METAATVPTLAPDGTPGDIPQARVQDAVKAGFKQAASMTSPDGKTGYIPVERQQDALKAGFKMVGTPEAPQEGFWTSLGHSIGVPTSMDELKANADAQNPLKHPVKAILGPAGDVAGALYSGAKRSAGELLQASRDAFYGNRAGAAVHGITAIPFVGPGMEKATDQYAVGNTAGEMGTLVGAALQAAPAALGAADAAVPGRPVIPNPKFPSKPPVSGQNYAPSHAQAFEGAIAPATAMGKNFIPQNITPEALTPIRATAARMAQGTPTEQGIVQAATSSKTPPLERLGAYQNIVQNALNDLESQHAPALAQNAKVPVDTTPIVQQLQGQISPTMAAADVSAIRQLIMRVRQAQTIGDLNKFRQELNVETAPEYRQSQVQAGRSGISAQTTSDLAGWVRNAYYDALQKATGTDFAPLKRQESNLITTQEALQSQQSPLAKAQATFSAPSTLREKAGNIANVVKDPKTTVTQTILRESPATKVSTLLQKSLEDLPTPTPALGVGQPQTIQGTPAATLRGLPSRYTQPQLPASTPGYAPTQASPSLPLNQATARMRVQPNQFTTQPSPTPSSGALPVTPEGQAGVPASRYLQAPDLAPAATPDAPKLTGKALWAQNGAQKMATHGVSASDIDALAKTPAGKQLLVIASALSPGSPAMKSLARQIPKILEK